MSCCSVNSFDYAQEKLYSGAAFQRKIQLINRAIDMFRFNHASALYTSSNIVKMLLNKTFKSQTPTRNPNALNMSFSLSQSACSIEIRCVVKWSFLLVGFAWVFPEFTIVSYTLKDVYSVEDGHYIGLQTSETSMIANSIVTPYYSPGPLFTKL